MDSESRTSHENDESHNGSGMAVLFTTTRHRCKLQEDGYFYVFDKMSTNGEKKFWRCEKKGTCNARIHTDAITNRVLKRATPHNHPSSSVRPTVQRRTLKRQSERSNDELSAKRNTPPLETLNQEITNASGFDVHQTEELVQHLKKEYGDVNSECCIRSLFPKKVINYPLINPIRTTAPPTTSMVSAESNDEFQHLSHLTSGGFIFWSDDINKIIDEGAKFFSMALNSNLSKCFSLLIKGAEKTGKSCLAAVIAKNSGIPMKVCLPENMVKLDEEAKKAKLIDLFDEANQLPQCILFLDAIDLLIEYCAVGDRYSNIILQTIKLLLKRGEMLQNNRLIVIATVSNQCAEKFGLHHYFSYIIEVPMLTEVEQLINVMEPANILSKIDLQMLKGYLLYEASSYAVGIKSLLTAIEFLKCCEETKNRFRTLFQYLSQWKR